MNYKLVIIFLILIGKQLNSQTHRFIYELTINSSEDTNSTEMVLDINKDLIKFYDYDFLRVDSIRKKTGNNIQTNSETDQLIVRKNNSFENKEYHSLTYDYYVINSNDKMIWTVENETRKVSDFKLQKATTNFGGRKWIAWFNPEIPFQQGPYKFQGLSGLIYEIYDSENTFHYSLIRSYNLKETTRTDDFLETRYGKKPISVNLKKIS